MPDWLWYAALGFNLGSGLAWWVAMRRAATRYRAHWQRMLEYEHAQTARWAHVERCSACTAWLNEDNGRLAARGLDDDG